MSKDKLKILFKIVGVIPLIIYFGIAAYLLTLNPDLHHDGILLSAGDAARNGLVPHQDFIFIWGPLLPYILSIPGFAGHDLLYLRFFGYFITCIVTWLTYRLNLHITTKKNSALLSLSWLLSIPAFSMFQKSDWPLASSTWPNIYGFAFILISVNIIFHLRTVTNFHRTWIIIAGLSSFAATMIRINFIFLYIAIFLILRLKLPNSKKIYLFTLPLIVIVIQAAFGNAKFVKAWFDQTFLVLLDKSYSTGVPNFSFIGFSRAIFALAMLSSIYFVSVHALKYFNGKSRNIFNTFMFLTLLLYFTFYLYMTSIGIENIYANKVMVWIEKINSEFALGFVALSFVFFVPFSIIVFKKKLIGLSENENLIPLLLLALASIPLSHNLNIDYLWLNSIFVISLMAYLVASTTRFSIVQMVIPSFIAIGLSLLLGLNQLNNSQIYSFKNSTLMGMRITNEKKGIDIDKEFQIINSIPNHSRFQNLCSDSIYGVNDNQSILSSKMIQTSNIKLFANELLPKSNTWLFRCNLTFSEKEKFSRFGPIETLKHDGSYSIIYFYK